MVHTSLFSDYRYSFVRYVLVTLYAVGKCEKTTVKDCLQKLQQKLPKGLITKEYQKDGTYPIIDQGQKYIAGYTDSGIPISQDLPLVIFGDHTRNIKYVDFPFVLGADGVKLYKPKKNIDTLFFYYALFSIGLPSRGYGRHNKLMQESEIYIPNDIELQKNIASFFQSLEEGTYTSNKVYFDRKIENHVIDKLEKVTLAIELQNNPIYTGNLITKLRQSILQDAIQGNLVPQDPTDEPVSVLLQKIKAEKEQLITGKKIKKQKPLPPITDDEKPFALPKGWEWVRLGEICTKITDGFHNTPPKTEEGYPYIAATHVIVNTF